MRVGYRFLVRILAICTVFAAGCGTDSNYSPRERLSATTGYYDAEGIDYTDGGDTRVAEALKREDLQPTPKSPVKRPIAERLKEFEISRLAKGEKDPSRFGDAQITIKIFFTDRNPISFISTPEVEGGRLVFGAEAGGFRLSGELTDTPLETKGEFRLISLSGIFEPAQIFYRAYKGKLQVRDDQNKKGSYGTLAEKQMTALKDGAFAWVHNWVVVKGPSFYLVDIVRTGSGPVFGFKGESKRTGERDHAAKTTTESPRTEVRLIGNSEEDSRRLFAVSVRENAKDEPEEFLLDVEWEKPESEKTPEPTPPAAKAGRAYLRTDFGTPRNRKMALDFNANRDLKGVQDFIEKFQGPLKRDLQNFYTYANPFRKMIERIGMIYDVSPAFAYLTVVESAYFTGGRYEIEGARTSTALGPFQFLKGTAEEVGLRVTEDANDERRYFTPSACGGARYIRTLVKQFNNGDSTLAILAYYQGYSRASGFARYNKLGRNYKYTYADMERLAVLPAHMRAYVNKKLAVYFISEDMERFGFKIPSGAPTVLPDNGTVFPPNPILDRPCRLMAESFAATALPSGS